MPALDYAVLGIRGVLIEVVYFLNYSHSSLMRVSSVRLLSDLQ